MVTAEWISGALLVAQADDVQALGGFVLLAQFLRVAAVSISRIETGIFLRLYRAIIDFTPMHGLR